MTPSRAELWSRRRGALLAGAAFALLAAGLFAWPIVPHDTDLWYHLNFGRRIHATGTIPASAWYSFLETRRDFVDYYWLSQWVLYALHAGFGALGVIALRAVLLLALAALTLQLALGSPLAGAGRGRALMAAALVTLVALERFSVPRPHMFSYTLLAAVLLLVERGGRALYALPLLAVLWANLHGIEFPVLLVVLGGALLERLPSLRTAPAARREAVAIAAAALGVLATPFGPRLLLVPFTPLGLVGHEIFELRPVTWEGLASFQVVALAPSFGALRALLIALAAAAVVSSLAARSMAPRHLAWLLGGAFLLVRAERFAVEFALLALPAITHAPAFVEPRSPRLPRPLVAAFAGVLVLAGAARFAALARGPWRYPVETSVLPGGAAALLRGHAAPGRVLHHPNYGGYLQWELGDRLRIAADLQTPFLFDGRTVLETSAAFADARALRAMAERVRADYVLVPWSDHARLAPALAPAYVPVGFDDVVVTYAHRVRGAALVAKAELRALAPERLGEILQGTLPSAEHGAVASELERLARLGGDVAIVRAAQAKLAAQRGAHALARRHATRAAALAPARPEVLRVAGEVLLTTRAAAAALVHFERGIELIANAPTPTPAPAATRSALARGAAMALDQLGRADETYALLRPLWREVTTAAISADDLLLLAAAAADAGESDDAATFAALARVRSGQMR